MPLSLRKIAHIKKNVVQSNELAEGYTLIPVAIFRVAEWGGIKIFVIDQNPDFGQYIQKLAYIMEGVGWWEFD